MVRCGPTPPVTRLFTQDAYTEYAILAPGSESFRIKFLPGRNSRRRHRTGQRDARRQRRVGRRGLTTPAPASRSSSPTSRSQRSRNARHPRHAADARARRRHRPRADLQDIQGPAHVHDARQRYRLGPQPQRLSPRRAATARIRLHLLERRRATHHRRRRPPQTRLRQPQRPKQPGDDPRPQDGPRSFRRRNIPTCSSTTSRRSTISTRPKPTRSKSQQTYSDYRKGATEKLDSLAYLPLEDLKVIDLDTAKPFTPVNMERLIKLDVPITDDKQSAHIKITGMLKDPGYKSRERRSGLRPHSTRPPQHRSAARRL